MTIGQDGVTEADLLVHDEQAEDPYLALDAVAHVLAGLPGPGRRPARDRAADPRRAHRGPARRPRSPSRARATSTERPATAARPGRSSEPGTGATGMHLPGLRVRQPDGRRRLRQLRRGPGRPRHARSRRTSFHGRLLGEHLDELGAPPPLDRRAATRRSTRSSTGCTRPRPTACSSSTAARLVGIFTDRDAVLKVAGKLARRHPRRATS